MVKKNSAYASFLNPILSVWISDETHFLGFDILHEAYFHNWLIHSLFHRSFQKWKMETSLQVTSSCNKIL